MPGHFSIFPYINLLVKKKKTLIINFVIISAVSLAYVLFFAKAQYQSSITFLPPTGNNNVPTFLSQLQIGSISSEGIMSEQIISIFNSSLLKRKLITNFDLYRKYKLENSKSKLKNALKILDKNVTIQSNEVGNLGMTKLVSFTIEAYHTSPDTSLMMINFTFSHIDSIVKHIGMERGKRSRIFISDRLRTEEARLDSMHDEMKNFQVDNKAYNIPAQMELTIKQVGNLRAKLLMNDIKIGMLKKEHSSSHPDILLLKQENMTLRSKVNNLESRTDPDLVVGLKNAANLMPSYINLKRDMEVQNKLILYLSQELERSKIREEKNVSSINIIDPAFIPEYKSRPKRSLICISMTGLYMVFVILVIFLKYSYHNIFKNSQAFNELVKSWKNR